MKGMLFYKTFYFFKFGFIPDENDGDLIELYKLDNWHQRSWWCSDFLGHKQSEFYSLLQEILSGEITNSDIHLLIVLEHYYVDIDNYHTQKTRNQFYYLKRKATLFKYLPKKFFI